MKKDIVQILTELVNISSYENIGRNHLIIQYLKNSLKDCSEIVVVESENGNAHLLVGVNCELKNINNCILLSGHVDTVPPSENHLPVSSYENGKIVGLGTSDMKGFIAYIIDNIEELKQSKLPVVLAITSDEEYDFYGIWALTDEMKRRNIKPGLTIVGEPTSGKFSVSNRGNSIFVCDFEGKACHSSTPELGINAIGLSMKMVSEIENLNNKYKGFASLNVSSVQGGSVSNIVPDFCSLKFSVRSESLTILQSIKTELELAHKKIGMDMPKSKLDNVFDIPPFEKRDNPFIQSASLKNEVEVTESAFTTEAGVIQQVFPNSAIVIYGPGNPTCIHQAGEHIHEAELKRYAEVMNRVVKNYASFKKELPYERNL